jgi:hypothetical protein
MEFPAPVIQVDDRACRRIIAESRLPLTRCVRIRRPDLVSDLELLQPMPSPGWAAPAPIHRESRLRICSERLTTTV